MANGLGGLEGIGGVGQWGGVRGLCIGGLSTNVWSIVNKVAAGEAEAQWNPREHHIPLQCLYCPSFYP